MPNANTAGIIAKPAMMANNVSIIAVSLASPVIFSFFLTYEAYVITVPQPMLKEKNA